MFQVAKALARLCGFPGSSFVNMCWSKYSCLKPVLVKHARIQKILSEGSNFDNVFFSSFFLVDKGRED